MTLTDVTALHGSTMVDRDGDKIGKIDEIYEDAHTGRPEWALVHTGLFGSKSTFVPISGASRDGEQVRVPFEKAQVKDAPKVEPDGQLTTTEEQELYRHYGLDWNSHTHDGDTGRFDGGTGTGTTGTAGTTGHDTVGHDTSGPTTDDAMT